MIAYSFPSLYFHISFARHSNKMKKKKNSKMLFIKFHYTHSIEWKLQNTSVEYRVKLYLFRSPAFFLYFIHPFHIISCFFIIQSLFSIQDHGESVRWFFFLFPSCFYTQIGVYTIRCKKGTFLNKTNEEKM